ncbi:hypothetical protein [Phreatobacter stygius]|uniref:Uncharacterized protein n=1 Tax=Phreatobacter stygius TaxID=1940610 RepID=A0A4D7B8W4_9HYPH|nr:hypothetical protein [Phreatobacter stygius]QCI64517.1 hypothetical protein E8M01_09875 [Phreatobacter stygius]
MSDALKILIETARGTQMSSGERETQRRSFAYGNTHFENPRITKEMVDREAERLNNAEKK